MEKKNYFKNVLVIFVLLSSAVSSFAQFIITSPNSSTRWEVGESCTVTWTNSTAPPTIVTITLVYTNGSTAFSRSVGVNIPTAPGTYSFVLDTSDVAGIMGNYYTVCFEDEQENVFTCSETFTVQDSVLSTGIKEVYANAINIYPMPLTDASALHFTLQKTAPVKAIVYDMLGNEITCLKNETMEPGAIDIDLPHLAQSGIYLLRLEVAGNYYTRKLVVN